MNKRERVIKAINHENTDICPHQIGLTKQAFLNVSEYVGNSDFVDSFNNHIEGKYYSGRHSELENKKGYFIDDFNVVWNRNGADKDIGVVDELCLPNPDFENYIFPTVDEAKWRSELEELIANREDKFCLAGIGFSMFERAWSLRGMENIMLDMVLNPDFLHELLDRICEFNLKMIDIAMSYKEIDGFYFGDDWGKQKGLIMGPEYYRTFIKPRVSKMYARVKENNRFVFQHSCGDISSIFDDLIEMGLDVYQTFQPEIYDVVKVKEEYGDRLTFWGGLSTQRLLPYATEEEVINKTVEMIKIMGNNGGYIAAPTHAIPFDVPAKNILAMKEVFLNQHKYI